MATLRVAGTRIPLNHYDSVFFFVSFLLLVSFVPNFA